MKALCRFLAPWTVLLAAVAIGVSASPARADILTFTDSNGDKTSYTVGNGSTKELTFAGFDITYTVTDKDTKNGNTITHDLGVTLSVKSAKTSSGTSTVSDSFKWSLSGSNYGASSNDKATVQSLLSVSSFGFGNTNKADTLKLNNVRAQVTSNGTTVTTNGVNWTNSQGTGDFNSGSPTAATLKNTYKLSDLGGEVFKVKGSSGNNPSSTLTFTATARVVGVPEPSGLAVAVAGLPCLGLLVGFVRMRRNPVPA
jgi:hypothetical protein